MVSFILTFFVAGETCSRPKEVITEAPSELPGKKKYIPPYTPKSALDNVRANPAPPKPVPVTYKPVAVMPPNMSKNSASRNSSSSSKSSSQVTTGPKSTAINQVTHIGEILNFK